MKKISLFGLLEDRDKIVSKMQLMGCVEPIAQEEEQKKIHSEAEEELAKVEYSLSFLRRFFKVKRSFFTVAEKVSLDRLKELADLKYVDELYVRLKNLDNRLSAIKSEISRLDTSSRELEPWNGFDGSTRLIKSDNAVRYYIGTVNSDTWDKLDSSLSCPVMIYSKSIDKISYFVAAVSAENAEKFDEELEQYDFNSITLPDGVPAEIINNNLQRISDLQAEQYDITDEIEKCSDSLDTLFAAKDYLSVCIDGAEAKNQTAETARTFSLVGWIPQFNIEPLTKELQDNFEFIHIEISEPEEGEITPVMMKNSAAISPFEIVTESYMTPAQNEIDPSPYMAPFFFTFFGIMLSDAGYGLLLSVMALIGMRYMPKGGTMRKFARLFVFGGVSALIWGALFGSWFGLGDPIVKPLWFAPMKDPMLMLFLGIGMGAVQILLGLALKAVNYAKNKMYKEIIFDVVFWYMLLIGLGLLAIASLRRIGVIVAVIGALGIVFTNGRDAKTIGGKLASGLYELYGITSYLSDLLSYSRLLGLGLASSVIGSVVNMLGGMLFHSPATYVLGVLVLIFGHLLNIALSLLGAYVHSGRLQYIEFYSKFFTGGGHAFKPVSVKTKYYEVN